MTTKTDIQLKQDIEQELLWDPKINAAQIGVSVDNGAVRLSGVVDTYPEKWSAADAAKRVSGVLSVSQELTVKVLSAHAREDADISKAIQSAFKWDISVPNSVTAKVHNGVVTLQGNAIWNFQREAAERAVRYLTGVVGIVDKIDLNPRPSVSQVKEKVEAALVRQAHYDAKSITVDTTGGKVTLSGHASSWQAITDAVDAAWAAPGVSQVDDKVQLQLTS